MKKPETSASAKRRRVARRIGFGGAVTLVGLGGAIACFGPGWVEGRVLASFEERGIAVDYEDLDISRSDIRAREICLRPADGPEVEVCTDSLHISLSTRGLLPRRATISQIEVGTVAASTSRRVADLPQLLDELRQWRPQQVESRFDVALSDDFEFQIGDVQVYADSDERELLTVSEIDWDGDASLLRFDADVADPNLISGATWSAHPVGTLSVSARQLSDQWQIVARAQGGIIGRETATLPCLQARVAEMRWTGNQVSLGGVEVENLEIGRTVASLPRVTVDVGDDTSAPIAIDIEDLIIHLLTDDPQLEGIACTRNVEEPVAGTTPSLPAPARPIEIEMSELGLAFADALGVPYTEFVGSARVRVEQGNVTLTGELVPPTGWEALGPLDLTLTRESDGALAARVETRHVPIVELLSGLTPDEVNAMVDGSANGVLTASTTEHGDVIVEWSLNTSPITVQVPRMPPQTIDAQSWSIRAGPSSPGAGDLVLSTGTRSLLGLQFEASASLAPFNPAEMDVADHAIVRLELPEQSLSILGDGMLDRAFGTLADAPIGQRFSGVLEIPVRWRDGQFRVSPPQLARLETESLAFEYTPDALTLSALGCLADATLQARLVEDPSVLVTLTDGTAPADNWRCRATDAARYTLRSEGHRLANSLRGPNASLGQHVLAGLVEEVVRAESHLDDFEVGIEIHNLDALSSIGHIRDVPRAIDEVVNVWGRLSR